MYCNSCGKPNPDGSAFCSSCGKALSSAPASPVIPRPTPPIQSSQTAAAVQKNQADSHFRRSWRVFATSPFALALIICHSVTLLLNIIDINSIFTSSEEMMSILSVLGSESKNSINTLMSFVQILIATPGVLIAIGLWMLYVDARDQSDRPINTKGLSLIRGTLVGVLVAYCVFMLFAVFTSCNALDELDKLDGLNNYYASEVRSFYTGLLFGLFIVSILVVVLYRLSIKLVNTVRESADFCSPDTSYVTSVMVICFIGGGLSVIGMFSAGITLPLATSTALPFLFGIMLMKYKQLMTTLHYASAGRYASGAGNNYASQFVQQSSQHIPTWQRVELEREKAQSSSINQE